MKAPSWSILCRRLALGVAFATALGAFVVRHAQGVAQGAQDGSNDAGKASSTSPYETLSLRGKVVWLSEALKRRYEIDVDPDAVNTQVALETAEGELVPLVKDGRGRGFHKDERLRGVPMELQVRKFAGSPFVQVIRVFTLREGAKYELDYWCEICAIPMYELKPCECCQGETRLREQFVANVPGAQAESGGKE